MTRERERRGLTDGGDRIGTIARWLRQKVKSERVTELVLTAWQGDDDPDVLSRYDRADAEGVIELAPELSALIQDYADDAGGNINAQLSWCTAEGQPWTSKRLRGKCAKEKEEIVRALDGSLAASLQQSQRHVENAYEQNARLVDRVLRGMDSSEARYERMFATMERINARVLDRLTEAEQEAADATEAAEQAAEVAEEAAEVAEVAVAQAEEKEGGDRLAQVIELAAKQFTSGG